MAYITAKCFDTADLRHFSGGIYGLFYYHQKAEDTLKTARRSLSISLPKTLSFQQKIRKHNNNLAVSFDVVEEAISSLDFEAFESSVEEKAIKTDMIGQVRDYLAKKSLDVRKIFHLRYSLDMTIPEISEKLSFSESKVKNIIYRTLCALRKIYTEAGDAK